MAAITGLIIASIIGSLAAAGASVGTALSAQDAQNKAIDSSNSMNRYLNTTNNQFNAEQAQIQRDWEERMANTAVQRRVEDLKAAGFNPALAVTSGVGSTPGAGGASSAGVPTMRAHDYSPMAQMAQNLGHLVNSAQSLVLLSRITRNNPGVVRQLEKVSSSVNNHITRASAIDRAYGGVENLSGDDLMHYNNIKNVNLWR